MKETIKIPQVTAVILNTNRRDDTLDCLKSLSQQSYPALSVMLLDNASTDGSIEAVRAGFPGVQIVRLAENKGYAGNNNTGIQLALDQGAGWVLVLNEDTLLAPECIAELVKAGENDPQAGIVGPMVYHFDEPLRIQSAGGIMTRQWDFTHAGWNEIDQGQYAAVRAVDWISGCALMIRRATVEQIGLIDERFFYYKEETEWCLRARRAGWTILHAPNAKLWHKGVTPNYEPSPSVTYYNTRNGFLFIQKHNAPTRVRLIYWLSTLRTLWSWTFNPRFWGMGAHRSAMLQGIRDSMAGRWGQRVSR